MDKKIFAVVVVLVFAAVFGWVVLTASNDEEALDADRPAGIELEIVDTEGYHDIISARRGDVVVVDFWATWCGPCVESFPKLVQLDAAYRDRGVTVIGASVDFPGDRDKVREFLQAHGAEFTNLKVSVDNVNAFISAVGRRWSGDIPAVLVYDRDGELAGEFFGSGAVDEAEMAVLDILSGD